MALVDYSSSDGSDIEEDQPETKTSTVAQKELKRKRDDKADVPDTDLPPLPSRFHDFYATATRASTRDDPSLHGGRKRATPHVEGNWPSHLYIEWYPKSTEFDALKELIDAVQTDASKSQVQDAEVNSFLTSDLGAPLPLHVSLSRPIGLKTEAKDEFLADLQQEVASSGIRPFNIQVTSLDWVPNFEKTRWFLVLRLCKPDEDGLNRLLSLCNRIVERYHQLPLYKESHSQTLSKQSERNPTTDDFSKSFHISIGWALEKPAFESNELLAKLAESRIFRDLRSRNIPVDEIKTKVGNIITSISLSSKTFHTTGLLGH